MTDGTTTRLVSFIFLGRVRDREVRKISKIYVTFAVIAVAAAVAATTTYRNQFNLVVVIT